MPPPHTLQVLRSATFEFSALRATTVPILATLLPVVVGFLLASVYGGPRTNVSRERITLHIGTPGYRVLRLSPAEVADVRLRTYMPLKEFGCYGIRKNREMTAYYLSAGTGVLMTTREGKKHLIGSSHPERLADVIRAVSGLPAMP